MDDNTEIRSGDVLRAALRKDFDMRTWTFDEFVHIGSEVLQQKETYQKLIGKFLHSMEIKWGENTIPRFSQALAETYGIKRSPETFRHWRWIYGRLVELELPDDLSYSAWEALARSDDPKKWFDRLIKNGWSSAELRREINISKGKSPNGKKEHICPSCGTKFND